MTIRKGEPWGAPSPSTGKLVTAGTDRELALLAHDRWRHHDRLTASVATGDLLTTVGLDSPRPAGQRWRFPVDLALLHVGDGAGADQEIPFVAHMVARRGLWRGEFAVAMNAPMLSTRWPGPLRLGPRAHPNDGVLDITVGALDWSQRLEAARRARTGSHLPHPDLRTVRLSDWHHGFDRPIPIRVDGHPVGSYRRVALSVVPDAFELIV